MNESRLRWFAVTGPFDSYTDVRVTSLYERIIWLEAIPVTLLLTDEERVPALSRASGVERVRPISQARVKIIAGLERLLFDGVKAWETFQPNGWAQDIPSLPNDPDGANKIPPYPDFRLMDGEFKFVVDLDHILQTRLGCMAAISLSIGPPCGECFDPEDPINAATHAASRIVPIVIAAGNYHQLNVGANGSMSAWAQAPWVISVGATDSEDGGKLLPSSSRGSPGHDFSGPTVVAWGKSLVAPDDVGPATSFAAPKVAAALCWLAAYTLTLRYFAQAYLGKHHVEGIPLPGFGTVDDGAEAAVWDRPTKLPALPRCGIAVDSLAAVLQTVQRHRLELNVLPTADALRQMLLASARPLPGYSSYEAGCGFVSIETVTDYLRNFTGADFVRLFCSGRSLTEDLLSQLQNVRLTDSLWLPLLLRMWEESRRRWFFAIEQDRPMFRSESGDATTLRDIVDTTKPDRPRSFTDKLILMHPPFGAR